MQYTLTISQTKALEWGLNAQQALLFSFVYGCPSWAKPITNEDGVFFALSKAKIVEELPLLTDKPDTAYRLLKQLEAAGVIELSHTPGITLVRLTEKGQEWNRSLDGSEKYPSKKTAEGRKNIRATSEKSPSKVGNKSDAGSEKYPTNQDTSNQGTNQGTSQTPADAQEVADAPASESKNPRKKFNPLNARPENISVDAWEEWCQYRREIRKPLTATMCKRQAATLADHYNPDAVLRQSIGNGWTGLFPEKIQPAAGNVHPFPGKARSTEHEDHDNDLAWMEQLRK